MNMDKKTAGEEITVVTVPAIGSFSLDKMPLDSLKKRMEEALK
jgi:3-dehydroquinate synthetase